MPRTNLSDQFDESQRREWRPKIVARNTFRFTRDGETVYRLHGTDVVRRFANGGAVLNSGGWKTVTTKDRINAYLPAGYSLIQDKGAWYVCNSSYPWSDNNAKRVSFFDGIQIPQCFDKTPVKARQAEARETKLRAQVRAFVARLDKLEQLPEPNNGDCWHCSMRVVDGADKGKSLGDATGDSSHLLEHVREGYLHGSLILNALQWAGYPNPGLIWHMENRDRQQHANGSTRRRPDWVKRALKRYLYRKLGLVS